MVNGTGGRIVAAGLLAITVACGGGEARGSNDEASAAAEPDSAFAALQDRGQNAMGVDQYTSTHVFDDMSDGGRIELQRDEADDGDVETIRAHLREIAASFAQGDFSTPGFVHAMREVPGTAVMAAKRDAITYTFSELPRGGEVRIRTTDEEAIRAIHEFLAFQRSDHRAGGHTH